MGALIGFLFSGLARIAGWFCVLLSSSATKFLVLKGMLLFLFVTILPVVLNNLIYKIMEIFMNKAASAATAFNSGTSPIVNLTGVGAYIATQIGLPEAVAIVLSAVSISATLRILRLN